MHIEAAYFESSVPTVASSRGLRVYSRIVVAAVFLLIFKGALVTSNAAGLAVPDWPTTFGENMFLFAPSKWRGIIFYEHVHRLLASGVGLLTVVLALWISFSEQRRHVRILAWLAVIMVIAQGVLGGLTVLHLLPPALSAAHGIVAQTFLLLTIAIAFCYSPYAPRTASPMMARFAVILLTLAYVQLAVGALMRHTGAGIAVPDFPTMGGEWWPSLAILPEVNALRAALMLPPLEGYHVALHLVHRLLGIVLFGLGVFAVVRAKRWCRDQWVINSVWCLAGITAAQVTLGIVTILSVRQPLVTSLHVVLGAAYLATVWIVLLRSMTPKPR